MKYFAMLLAAVFFFTGCDDDDVLGSRNTGKERPEVTVTPGMLTDTEAAFSLSVSENAAQYGYVVLEGDSLSVPNGYDILTNSVTATVKRGVFNYADASSMTASFACKPESSYTVFAAAITSDGLLSEVRVLKLDIDDTTEPSATAFRVLSGNSVMVMYNNERALFFSKSSELQATVRYTKPGASRVGREMVITDPQPLAREDIVIDGANVTFTVPKQPGTTFLIDYPAGFFTDAAGNPCLQVRNVYNESKGDFSSVHGDIPAEPFAILPEYFEKAEAGTDWSAEDAAIRFTVPAVIYDAGQENSVHMAYYDTKGLKYLNAGYTLTTENAQTTLVVKLPEVPEGTFDVEIAEGAFFDEWGNPSAAFSRKPDEFRYKKVIDIQTGRHLVTYKPLTEYNTGITVLSKTSGEAFILGLQPYDKENGLYMIGTTWFNMNGHPLVHQTANAVINPVLLGKVDYASKTIVFDGRVLDPSDGYKSILKKSDGTDEQAYGTAFYADNATNPTQVLRFGGSGTDGMSPIVIRFDDNGKLISISKCSFTLYNLTNGKWVGVAYYDAIWETGTLTYAPLE